MADQFRDLVNMVARREEQPAQAQEVRGSSINDKSARAVIEAGAITIRVPAENLPAIVEGASGAMHLRLKVTDPQVFAKELIYELNKTVKQTPSTTEDWDRRANRPVFVPPSDIYETKDSIVVLAEMPGVAPDAVDITLERRVLTIRGRSAASEHAGYQRVYNEYADGDYERVFTLSENIDRDRIEATLKEGVLHLVLPKAETAKARKIELKAS